MRDDAQLIDETLAGCNDAFGQLVQKYQQRLFNTMVYVTGSHEEAEDVVQEAFVLAFVKLSGFAGRSAFYSWLYRIAFNVSASRRRRKRPEFAMEMTHAASSCEPVDAAEGPADALDRQERAQQVQAALAELSEEHRAVLVLREMEGACYEKIADMLDLPIGTVRSRIHRARSQLRERLKNVLQQPS